ncbi:MAG TPA: SHOCT domain-containing protein [Candidatus Hydrogenedentes bacterium]|nr:SHOCT domain-containing protein [Candidatus Hydrogenedentota bacterium]
MLTGFITLLITDVMLLLIIQLVGSLFANKRREFPLHYAVLMLVFCCVAHYAATSVMANGMVEDSDRWLVLAATFGCGAIPIAAYVTTVFHHPALARTVKREDALAEARKLEAGGDIKEALRSYCAFLDVNPENHGVWFEAAHMLIRHGEFALARNILVKMRDRFGEDREIAPKIQELWRMLPRPSAPGAPVTRTAPKDPDAALRELIVLRKAGIITEEEYQTKKQELFEL